METKFQSKGIKLLVKSLPVPSVEIFNNGRFWFSTTNPNTLLDVSKVIAEFAKALNEEGIKMAEEHNKQFKKEENKPVIEEL